MKLFYIERTDNYGYDEYDSCVVAAENLEEAELAINPMLHKYDSTMKKTYITINGEKKYFDENSQGYSDCGNHFIIYIGESILSELSIVCSSFNAG